MLLWLLNRRNLLPYRAKAQRFGLRWVFMLTGFLVEMHAFLKHSQRADFSFAVPDHERKNFEEWARTNPRNRNDRPVEIYGRARTVGRGLDAIAPDILLNLHGRSDVLLRMRDRALSRA